MPSMPHRSHDGQRALEPVRADVRVHVDAGQVPRALATLLFRFTAGLAGRGRAMAAAAAPPISTMTNASLAPHTPLTQPRLRGRLTEATPWPWLAREGRGQL